MRCLFLYNPVSGRGKVAKKADMIVRALQSKYEIVDVYETKEAGDMERAAREGAESYDALVFSGGDGTFNEVVQGVMTASRMPEIGYIPGGTVNDIAHSLGIPKRIRGALKVILTGKNEMIDCMRINDRFAMYVVAAGAFTSASYTTPQSRKKQVGRLAYGIEGLRKNLNLRVFDVKVASEDTTVQADSVFVTIMNGKYVAGMKLNRGGSMQDGKLEAAVVLQKKHPNIFRKIRAFFSLAHLFLLGYKVRARLITRLEGSHFEVRTDDAVVWNFDGEKGVSGNVVIDVLPRKINMIVPKKRNDF